MRNQSICILPFKRTFTPKINATTPANRAKLQATSNLQVITAVNNQSHRQRRFQRSYIITFLRIMYALTHILIYITRRQILAAGDKRERALHPYTTSRLIPFSLSLAYITNDATCSSLDSEGNFSTRRDIIYATGARLPIHAIYRVRRKGRRSRGANSRLGTILDARVDVD